MFKRTPSIPANTLHSQFFEEPPVTKKPPPVSQRIGKLGEQLALKFFLKKGYNLLLSNYRIFGGEIDLILQKDDIILFVEVKTRQTLAFGYPHEAFTWSKKQKLLRAIHHFLATRYVKNQCCTWQLDLVSLLIDLEINTASIQHFSNILATES